MKRPKKIIGVAALLLSCAIFAACADKKAAETLYIKALESYERKDLNQAGAFINKSLECDQKNEQAKFLKAKINFFQGQPAAAAEILLDLQQKNSDQKDIQLYLIKSLLLDGQTELAQKEIQRALEKDRGDWRLYHLAAVAAAKTDDAERRLEALSGAQRALDGAAQIYFDLSLLWLSLGIESKAQEFKEKCLALDKSYLELY